VRDTGPTSKRLWGFAALFIAAYGLVIVAVAGRLSLWVDEVIQLLITRGPSSLGQLLRGVAGNPAGVPLGYVTQHLVLQALGFSNLIARLPSVVFSLLACGGMLVIARQLRLKAAILAPVLFALMPLQFRYAAEGRPYSQALALSVGATCTFLWLCARPGLKAAAAYALLLAAGLYTQPFVLFIGGSHVVWCLFSVERSRRMPILIRALAANAVAAALFLPWLIFAAPLSRDSVQRQGYEFRPGFSILSITFREVCGHYAIVALVALACIYALRMPDTIRGTRSFLWISVLLPIAGAVIGDAIGSYFFAARQIIFIIPGIALLAAEGCGRLLENRARPGLAFAALLVTALAVQDARAFTRPREDWALAAQTLKAQAGEDGCVLAAPQDWDWLYRFFAPAPASWLCGPDLRPARRVVLAITPYTSPQQLSQVERSLETQGFSPLPGAQSVGGTRIRVFRRP
jgi:hypothetical protein